MVNNGSYKAQLACQRGAVLRAPVTVWLLSTGYGAIGPKGVYATQGLALYYLAVAHGVINLTTMAFRTQNQRLDLQGPVCSQALFILARSEW